MKLRVLGAILALCACQTLVQGQTIDYVFASKKKSYKNAKNSPITIYSWTNLIEGYDTHYLFLILKSKRKTSNTLAWL